MSARQRDEYRDTAVDGASAHSSDHDFRVARRQFVEVRCECGHSNCNGEITIPLQEYEAVRLHPTRFLIKEGHEVADVVRVVGYGTGYVVVAKFEQDVFSVRDVQ
jgi:hypothetical protein